MKGNLSVNLKIELGAPNIRETQKVFYSMRPMNITVTTANKYYHEKDPFFSKDTNSKWLGKLCKNFDLDGLIRTKAFTALMLGVSPKNGQQLIKINRRRSNRVCLDFPLAAPKSVSILALHGNQKELIEAHQSAVKETLKYLEKNYIYYRKTVNKVTEVKQSKKAIFATFVHSTSRSNDPHLHTHCLIPNLVKTKDGYRSLFNDRIFKDRALLSSIYLCFLRENVKNIGYKIGEKNYGWDIEGFEKKTLDLFSKRKLEIIQHKETIRILNKNKKDKTVYLKNRRDKKLYSSSKEIVEYWNKQINISEVLKKIEISKNQKPKFNIQNLIDNEKMHVLDNILNETESSFTKETLLKTTMKHLQMNILEAEKFLSKFKKKGDLIKIKENYFKSFCEEIYSTKK